MRRHVWEWIFRRAARRLASCGVPLERAQSMVWFEYREVDGPAHNTDDDPPRLGHFDTMRGWQG